MAFRVLVVSDKALGKRLAIQIRAAHFDGLYAESLSRAERALAKPGPWLVFAAAQMNPLELLRYGHPIVVVGPGEQLAAALTGGATDYLRTPFEDVDVLRVLLAAQRRAQNAELRPPTALERANSVYVEGDDDADIADTLLHEINNPLTALMGYTDEAAAALDEGRTLTARAAMSRAQKTLEHVVEMTRAGRTLMRRTDGPGDPRLALEAAATLAGSRSNPEVIWHAELDMPAVDLPTHRLAQCVLNLVINARHAGSTKVVMSGVALPDEVQIDVIDDGHGMDESTLSQALDKGYTTKARGTGLGLHMVRQLVEASGGYVELLSAAGRGTRVRIGLPAHVVTSAAAPSRSKPA